MKEIVVLSGKGGTGKTSIVGAFASLAENKVLVDCDVDAADLHLLLQPTVREQHEFRSGQNAFIDKEKCTGCGLCEEVCRFRAITEFTVNPISCEGCGFCYNACPVKAISMEENIAGQWYISNTRDGPLVHARLGIAQENSGKLVALVRQKAREMAGELESDFIICDGPPGIGCPVISSLSGADLALLITEPTLSGQNDLERVIGVCHHFEVPAVVCINKYDISRENSLSIEKYCENQEIPVVAKIPYNNVVTEAMVKGLPVVEYDQSGFSERLVTLWETVADRATEDEQVKHG
jgi:MinD superfamily P-loop ATPase